MKRLEYILLVVVLTVISSTVYNHYDRVRHERAVEKTVKNFNNDVDFFIELAIKFERKADELVSKVEKSKLFKKQK
jgi:hypothetical protein